jgi:A/G-specific adenine glycosylase
VLAFAHGQRAAVLDTNVRRVLGRLCGGVEHPAPAVTVAERRAAEELLPDEPAVAARWAVALMELGALVCTARAPRCDECPVARRCAWRAAGYPAYDGPPRRGQAYEGTDRQARGRILAVLRAGDEPVPESVLLAAASADPDQAARALASLAADALVVAEPADRARYRLP